MTSHVVVGNVFDKYGTRNPLYRWVVGRYFDRVGHLLEGTAARRILEVGCGEGYVTEWVRARTAVDLPVGLDISVAMLQDAASRHSGVRFACGSAYELPFPKRSFDLVLCLEVLEHLDRPREALREAQRVCTGHLLASVPREPLWRFLNLARGAYWNDWGNTPGHVQHWSKRSFLAMLQENWAIQRAVTVGPWTLAVCSPG